jgi:hypothetical protein
MAINSSTTVVGVTPRISPAKFTEILRDHGSPAAMSAEAGYAAVEQQGIDLAFALAIFHQESQFATDTGSATSRFDLSNPGHTRTSRIGVGIPIDTPWGPFMRHPSWSVDGAFFYAQQGRRSIWPILELWVPPTDIFDKDGLNNTDIYVRNVARHMTEWADLLDGGTPIEGGGGAVPVVPTAVLRWERQAGG